MLLQENRVLKEQISNLLAKVTTMVDKNQLKTANTACHNLVEQCNSNSSGLSFFINGNPVGTAETEIVITDLVIPATTPTAPIKSRLPVTQKLTSALGTNRDESNSSVTISNIFEGGESKQPDVTHAVLASIYPELKREDIVSIRLLRPQQTTATGSNTCDSRTRCFPWAVSLSNKVIVDKIMHAKRNITRFCTGDVNVAFLDPDTTAGLTNGKIFINELLDSEKFRTL